LRAEGFFCSLEIFYGGLGILYCSFEEEKKFSINFLFHFGSSKSWIRLGIQHKMLVPDSDPYQMNTDPKHSRIVTISLRQERVPKKVCMTVIQHYVTIDAGFNVMA
jgi:hypothetical protein